MLSTNCIGFFDVNLPGVKLLATFEVPTEKLFEDFLKALESMHPIFSKQNFWEDLEHQCKKVWNQQVYSSHFWVSLQHNLSKWQDEYFQINGRNLIQNIPSSFDGKGKKRVQEKLFQMYQNNGVEPSKLFKPVPIPNLKDLVRTRLSTVYLDGVHFLRKKIIDLGKNSGVEVDSSDNKSDGYFATHLSFNVRLHYSFESTKVDFDLPCEIQLATQLQTILWERTHAVYEQYRSKKQEQDESEWQWNPSDPRFICRQIGHMVHLVDGLLVNLDDRRSNK